MEPNQESPAPRDWTRTLMGFNLLLGLLLWIGLCSDLALSSQWANYLLPPLIGLLGVISLRRMRRGNRSGLSRRARLTQIMSCLPGIAGGIPSIILAIIAFIPPILFVTILGGLFSLSEQANATVIQQSESPDGHKTAKVIFYPVGAYSGGNGRITVHLRYPNMPLIQRDVYYLPDSYEADGSPQEYVTWMDEDTLLISEEGIALDVGHVQWEFPWFVYLTAGLVYGLAYWLGEWISEVAPLIVIR
jgi:hypothetical protein